MSLVKFIDLPDLGDERGGLVAIESNKNIPFEIKRIYYIFATQNKPRGFHAHKQLKQIMFCIQGSCQVILDNGYQRENINLDQANKGLIIESMIWHEMHNFSDDCVLLVLANEYYDERDYIRDYEKFLFYRKLNLIEYDKLFLEKSWYWLNDKEIKYLTMTPDFTREKQLEFFDNLINRIDYKIWGIAFDNEAIGACGFKNIENNYAELWLYIGEKKYWHKGLGKIAMEKLENLAKKMNISKIYLKVLCCNYPAINLYKHMNYSISETNDKYYIMEKNEL